ncbi:MAG: ABC transporter permease [Halobacteria archaeon]
MGSIYLRYALRNFAHRRGRTALTLLGVTIGVAAIVTLVALADGLQSAVISTLEKVQRITVTQRGVLFPESSILPADTVERVERVEGVLQASPQIHRTLGSIESKEVTFNLIGGPPPSLLGIDPARERLSPGSMVLRSLRTGRFLIPGDRLSAVLGKDIAEAFHKQVGDVLRLEKREFRVVGIFETGSPFVDGVVVVPLEIAREMAGLRSGEVNTVTVDVREVSDIDRVARRIALKIPEVNAETPATSAAQLSDLLGTVRSSAFAVTALAAIVGGIGVTNSMLMNVLERRREIGVLKAVGWSNGEVMRAILLEGAAIGLLGGTVGAVLGAAALPAIQAAQPSLAYNLSPALVVQALLFALFLGLLGGLYPAWSTTRIQPAEALRYE